MQTLLLLGLVGLVIALVGLGNRLAALTADVERTKTWLRSLTERLRHLESEGSRAAGESPTEETAGEFATESESRVETREPVVDAARGPTAASTPAVDAAGDPWRTMQDRREVRREGVVASTASAPSSATDDAERFSIEELLGGKWLTWVGAIAVVLGAGFFFKYAMDEGWIGPTARVLIGLVVGLATFAGGVFAIRRDYGWLAQGLVGAAAGVLYFDLWAAEHLYQLIPMPVAFAAMTAVTVATLAVAAISASQPTAILGLIGGFLVPLILDDGVDRPFAFFGYLMLLDVGVLAIALFHRWRPLQQTAFGGTLLLWTMWFGNQYDASKLPAALLLTTAFFLLFTTLAVWESLVRRGRSEAADAFLMVAVPTVYFGTLLALVQPSHSDWNGTIAILLAVFHGALACGQWAVNRADRQAVTLLAGVAISFVVVAVPLELTGHWIVISWAVLGGVLVEAGLYGRQPRLREAGFGLLGVVAILLAGYAVWAFGDPAVGRTWFFRGPPVALDVAVGPAGDGPAWTSVFNARSSAFLVTTAVLALLAWEYRRRERVAGLAYDLQSGDVAGGLIAAAPLLLIVSAVVETFVFGRLADWHPLTIVSAFTGWTTLGAVAVVALGRALGPPWLRHVGSAVFGVVALLLVGNAVATMTGWQAQWPRLVERGAGTWGLFALNPRGLSFAFAIVGASLAAWLARADDDERTGDGQLTTTQSLALLAHLAGFVMLTTEVHAQGVIRDWQTKTSLAITGTWTLYAIATLLAGIQLRSANVRILALALFVLTTGKVFLYDVWYLHRAIRTLAFTGLGASLLLVSWLYRRHRERIREWLTDDPRDEETGHSD